MLIEFERSRKSPEEGRRLDSFYRTSDTIRGTLWLVECTAMAKRFTKSFEEVDPYTLKRHFFFSLESFSEGSMEFINLKNSIGIQSSSEFKQLLSDAEVAQRWCRSNADFWTISWLQRSIVPIKSVASKEVEKKA